MKKTILKNAMVLTLNDKDEMPQNTDILIEDGIIKGLGSFTPCGNDEVVDCTDLLVMPGFVNAHLHSDENLLKGMYDNLPLELWMLYSYPPSKEYGYFSDRLVYLRTLLGAVEQIKSGVTCCQDDVSGHPVTSVDSHRIIFDAYNDIGMRVNLTTSSLHKNYLDTIPFLRELVPPELQKEFSDPQPLKTALDTAENIIRQFNNKGLCKVTLSPIAPQRCDDEYNVAVYELAEKYNLPYHTHICETRMQRETGYEFYNETITAHCHRLGILSERTTIAHANWLDDNDIDILAKTKTNVVHNIVSNLKLGSGVMPFYKMHSKGVNICLGTDGASSNDSQNIMEVMKTAALIHKVTQADYEKNPTADMIIDCAVKNGAKSVMRQDEIGSVEVGKKADLIMFDLNSYAFAPLNKVKNHIVYCENGRNIRNVMINGKMVLKDGEMKTIDERSVLKELRELHGEYMSAYKRVLELSDKMFPYVDEAYRRCVNMTDTLWRFTASKDEYPF